MPSDSPSFAPTVNGAGIEPPAIDGVRAERLLAPGTAQDVADVLAEAADRRSAVAPIGGGTALGLGNIPERIDLALSTRNLGGVLDYEPMDLVLSVGAGATFGEVRSVLAEHGQGIPLEAPNDDTATIGGLVATALAGPRRLGSGSLRDLLIGIAVAHPSGTVSKAGGMVVKNVTGFDLTRLYLGSLGTLGVIVSANFKVLPLPRHEATLLLTVPDIEAADAASRAIRTSALQPTALEITGQDGAWTVAVRVEGREGTVTSMLERIRALVGRDGDTVTGPDSAAWWRTYVDFQAPTVDDDDVIVVRCGVRPRETTALLRAMLRMCAERALAMDYVAASPGLGSVVARLRSSVALTSEAVGTLQTALASVSDTTTILAVHPEAKRGIDIWGAAPETLDVMRKLKDQFDPHHVVNPGRFAGRI